MHVLPPAPSGTGFGDPKVDSDMHVGCKANSAVKGIACGLAGPTHFLGDSDSEALRANVPAEGRLRFTAELGQAGAILSA